MSAADLRPPPTAGLRGSGPPLGGLAHLLLAHPPAVPLLVVPHLLRVMVPPQRVVATVRLPRLRVTVPLLRALRDGAQDSVNQAGQRIVEREMKVPPTLTIRPGHTLRVIVTRDLVFENKGSEG